MNVPVRYAVVFESEALHEAKLAASYIALHSPRRADRWFVDLTRVIQSFAIFPRRCPIARESKFLGRELRQRVYKSHRIIFEIDESERVVRILHVRHAARRAIGEPNEDD